MPVRGGDGNGITTNTKQYPLKSYFNKLGPQLNSLVWKMCLAFSLEDNPTIAYVKYIIKERVLLA